MMRIQLQLILSACVVNSAWTHLESRSPVADEARTSVINNRIGILHNVQNLFESIAKNEMLKSGQYRDILKREVAKGREAYGALEGQLLNARSSHTNKQKNSRKNSRTAPETVLVEKRETDESDENVTATVNALLDRAEMGNLTLTINGTDVEAGNVTLTMNATDAETQNETTTILSTESTLPTSTIAANESARPTRRERRKALFDRLVKELGDHDETKMTELTTAPDNPYREMSGCFLETYDTFMRFCRLSFMGGGVKYFKLLLSVACDVKWLNTEKICTIVSRSCQPRLYGRNY